MAIRMPTGWDRGADGKWRYETEDYSIKEEKIDFITNQLDHKNTATIILKDLLEDAQGLFAAYPELRNMRVVIKKDSSVIGQGELQWYDAVYDRQIVLNEAAIISHFAKSALERYGKADVGIIRIKQGYDPTTKEKFTNEADKQEALKTYIEMMNEALLDYHRFKSQNKDIATSILTHEIQHAIQFIEGFARGSSPKEFADVRGAVLDSINFMTNGDLLKGNSISNSQSLRDALNKKIPYTNISLKDGYIDNLQKVARKYGYDNIDALVDDFEKMPSAFEQYHRTAGEVEARNASARMGMSADERRATLLSETEDVAREDQIFLMENSGVSAMAEGEIDINPLLNVVKTLYTKGKEFASRLFSMKFFDVAKTPDFMKQLGLRGDKFTIRYGVIARHFGKDSEHALPYEIWEQLPEVLLHPFAITKYYEDNNKQKQKGYRLYTSLQLANGAYVVVSAEVKNSGRDIDVNAINTVFGRSSLSEVHDKLIYTSETITPEQQSLLNGNNPHQYTAERELSTDKGSDNIGNVQGLEDYSAEELKEIAREYIEDVIAESGFDAEVVDLAIYGSRRRGDGRDDSDLDIVVEYSGNAREDDLFNALNDAETQLEIDGVKVDINPITKSKSGTLGEFMERAREYDEGNESNESNGSTKESQPLTNPSAFGTSPKTGEESEGSLEDDGLLFRDGDVTTSPLGSGGELGTTMSTAEASTVGYSDADVSMANDPISKVMGRSQRSKKQQTKFAERERKYMRNRVAELAEKMHLDNVEVVESSQSTPSPQSGTPPKQGSGGELNASNGGVMSERKARAKGWFDTRTGRIVINISNHTSVADVERTLLHEAVAHYGLRQLFGKQFDTFLDNVYLHADAEVRAQIIELAKKHGWDFRTATEEYLAGLAEDTNFEYLEYQTSFWMKIKRFFMDMLESIGWDYKGPELSDNELRYLLWRSYENMVNPGRHRSILGKAEDVAKQYALGVGNYSADAESMSQVAEPKLTIGGIDLGKIKATSNGRKVIATTRSGHNQIFKSVHKYAIEKFGAENVEYEKAKSGSIYMTVDLPNGHYVEIRFASHTPSGFSAGEIETNAGTKGIGWSAINGSVGAKVDISFNTMTSDDLQAFLDLMNEYAENGFPQEVVEELQSYRAKSNEVSEALGISVDTLAEGGELYSDGDGIEAVNERFNTELQQQIDGTLPKGHIYQLGMPSEVLLATGIAKAPIQLNSQRLMEKSSNFGHDYELSELKDLVKAINNPIAIFAYGDKNKAQNIVVEIQHEGKNFIIGLSIRPTVGGQVLDINSIRNVFPKDNAEWLNWITQGKALYIDKERVQDLINQQRTNLADVAYLDLNSIANIIQNFENPIISREENNESMSQVAESGAVMVDNQGNPIDEDGKLIVEKVSSIDDITDADFETPTRSIQLPSIPPKVDEAIGANGKPIVIKKNVFEKNKKSHKDLTPKDSRAILLNTLYSPDLYGQNQKITRPYNWILIHLADTNTAVLVEVNENKDNVEIVNWHYINDDAIERKKKQAIREGGLILTLESAAADTSNFLPSADKGTINLRNTNELGEKIAEAESEVNTNPTDKQKEAGNYKKGHVKVGPFNITIEQPKGSVRRGVDADGNKWETEMQNTYGYIRGTEGVDGDHIDVFLSDDIDGWDGHKVFVVDQRNADGSFDEHKVMLGFNDINDAEAAYMSNYEEGWQGLGAITGVSIEEFEKWIASSHRKTKAFAEYKSVKTTEEQSASAERRNLADFKEGDVVRDYYDKKLYRIKKHSKNGVSTIAMLDEEGNEVGTTQMNAHNNSRYSLAEAPVKAETPSISQEGEQVSEQDNAPYTIAPAQYTTKKGKVLDMYLVKFAGTLTKEQQRAAKELAKAEKGWYDREQGGFMMRSEESAKQLADTILSNDDAVSDAQPVSLADTRKVVKPQQVNVESLMGELNEKGEAKLSDHVEQPTNPSGNRLVTDERYAELRERMRKKLGGQMNIGIDPEILAIGTEMAVYHLEKGARKFTEYAKVMIADLGDAIRPYLKAFYNGARELPEVVENGLASDMTSYDEVQSFDVATFDKEHSDPFTTAEIVVAEQAHQEEAEQAKQEIINQRNTERRNEDEQTSASTEAIASQAETVADKAESDIETATTEEQLNDVVDTIDKQIEEVNKQLALLGYYEADIDDSQFHESYGYMRSAEKKAVKDADALAKRIVKDLGIDPASIVDKKGKKRKVIAQANIAPAGGDVSIRLPLTASRELYIDILLEPDYEGGNRNNLFIDHIYLRIEDPTASGYKQFVGRNVWVQSDATYTDMLDEIRAEIILHVPEFDLPARQSVINTEQKQTKAKKSKNKSVTSQQSGEFGLFDTLFDNETNNKDGLQRNDATRSEGVSANGSRHNQRLSTGSETGSGRKQQRSRGTDNERERTGDEVDRTVRPRLSDTVTEPKNTRNNHSERGKDHAPTSVDARIEANIKAIELAKQLLESGEQATEKQMQTLRKFSGWGGLGKAFSEGTYYAPNNIAKRLRELLGEAAYQEAVMSANSAYYTPAYVVDTLWDIAEQMGFKGGNILEGSAGIGNILGQMPTHISERSDIHAIEIDGTSGGILSLLYPDAKVEIQGFEETHIANGSVDLAITNVPFVTGLRVNDTTGDKDLSKKFHNIHDFCIAKNVRKLREGGLGIFITSNGTLDNSKKLRDWIVNEGGADFVGAFRMHNKTFGGTGVTSDIIVIRKRVNGKKSANAIDVSTVSGERVAEYDTGETRKVKGQAVPVVKQLSMDYNQYFIEHPEMMAGEMYFAFEKGDTFRPTSKGLYPKQDKKQEQMLAEFVQSFKAEEFGEKATDEVEAIDTMPGKKIGEVFVSDGKLYINAIGTAQPLEVNANKVKGHTKVECFEAYTAIKEALAEVLKYQTENEDDEGLKPLLDSLNRAYDDFVATYGHFNKNTAIAFLRNDVDYANVFALEKYEETADAQGNKVQKFDKTDVFSKRVVQKEKEPEPTNVKDGIVASIFKYGRIDVPYIAEHLNKSSEEVKQEIIESGYGYEDPTSRQVEVSYLYLSGNVREKLRQAQENNENGVYDRNIKALQEVMPMSIPAHLIDFNLGSSWIEPKLYEEYVKERTEVDVKFTAVGGTWFMKEPYFTDYEKNRAMGVTSEMLRRTVMGHTLIEAAIQNRSITVSATKKNWDGSTETITDKEATQACAEKIDEIRQDFKEWARQKMQSDTEMSERMERIYNDTFNNYVPMKIPDDFVPEYFGGASHEFKMRPHQGRAIVRGTMQPLLLAHEVGTGKTFTLISTAMEMRRLGTARKPMIVVQNATVGQFVESAKELYPNAKILTLEEADRSADGRKNFYAKIKYNDWDMIVVPQSTFEFIPDSEERQMTFVQEKIEEKMLVLEKMKEADPNGNSMITRQAEREIAALEEQLAELSDGASRKRTAADEKKRAVALQNAEVKALEMLDRRTDDVENFDDMGIDALLIDEAHEYKHLGFATAMQRGVKGVDPSYSKKSQGVFLKTQAVLEKNNGKNVIFATGTPISNTAAEIWTFMRYLMPADTMQEYDIYYFDDFVRNFGNIQQMLEFTTSGKFKENNRFAGYVNLPELVRIWSGVSDTVLTKEAGEVSDKIPEMESGKAQDLYLPQSRALRSIMKFVKAQLAEYEKMSGKRKKENSHIPLTMYGIAKAAAVDARLVQSDAEDDTNSKTNEAVRQTLRSLKETEDYKGTVAIFADNYQNKESGFNLYEDIRSKLIAEGVPANEIVVMKSGMTVKKKLDIFEKVNRGDVRVILGSTFTLGTGVNIQERLHTLIHLDAPNRPMDYTQRNGRILRQGNLHKAMGKPVRILRFGVEDSLDVTAYQRLKTKGAIADSIMNGKQMMANSMTNRVLEEEEDVFGDTVAQLSGSEYAMLKNNAEKNVRKYESRKKQWEADQAYIHNAKPKIKGNIKDAEKRIEDNTGYLEAVSTVFPDGKFKKIVIGKNSFTSIEAMEDFLKEHNKNALAVMKQMKEGEIAGEQKRQLTIDIGDFSFVVTTKLTRQTVRDGATLFNDVERKMTYSCAELGIEDIPVRQNLLRNAIEDITMNVITGKDFAERLEIAERVKRHNEAELEQLLSREGKPFEYEAELEQARTQYEEYAELMKKELEEKEAKYAEMDATVETADNVSNTDEEDDALYRSNEEVPRLDKYRVEKIFGGIWIEDEIEFAKFVSAVNNYAFEENGEGIAYTDNYFYAYYLNIDGNPIPFASAYLNEAESQDVVNQYNKQTKENGEQRRVREYIDRANAVARNIQSKRNAILGDDKGASNTRRNDSVVSNISRKGRYFDRPDLYVKAQRADRFGLLDEYSREGTGAYSDEEINLANDPVSKALGKPRGTRKQRREFAQRERQRMVERVERLAKKLNLDNVEIVTDASTLTSSNQLPLNQSSKLVGVRSIAELEGKKQRAKGFYTKSTGKITIVIPNHSSTFDVEQTFLHEAVAHYGLRQLFGEHFDTFLDNVFNNADEAIRQRIVALAAKNGWDFHKATEEYLAMLAENTEFEAAHRTGWWQQIKDFFLNMLHKIGFEDFRGVTLTDNELRYILWRSYENLAEPGKYRSILGEAADVAKQYELGVGNFALTNPNTLHAAESDDELYRDGDPEIHERELARDRYERRVKSGMFQSQEALQDSMLGLKEAMQAILGQGTNIEDVDGFENAYLGENRLSSVNKAEADAFAHLLFKPMLEEVTKLARNEVEREELTDYMMAKHGLERNAYMRNEAINNGATDADQTDYAGLTALTGMDNVADAEAEAQQMVDDYEQKNNTTTLWEKVNAVSKAILQKSYDSGMMSKETFDRVSDMYEFYIPLRGFDEKTSAEAYAYLDNKHSAFNAPIKKAKGRRSKADDPFAYLQSMAEGVIMQGNRNKLVKQRFLNFALNHPSDLVSVSDIWVKYDAVTDEWKPVFPNNIESTDTPEEVEKKMKDFEAKMESLAQQHPDQYKRGKDAIGIPYRIVEGRDLRQHQVVVKRSGRDYVITINGNPRAAQALNGQTNPDNDMSGAIGAILRAGEKINRRLSAFYTTRNPDFIVSNFMRDMLYTNSMVWIKESPNYALRFHRNYLMVNPVTMKRLLAKYRKGTLDMSNRTEAMFHQFMMNGGETGYANIRDIEQHKNDIKKELKRANGKLKLARAWSLLAEKFDELNRAVENCARFAAFVTSREMGRSIDRAIYDAKEISVNFNKKGSGAKFYDSVGQTKAGNASALVSGLGRSGYVFWNAAIQGTTNFGRQMKRHPAKAFTGIAAMFLLGAIVAYLGGDDDEDDKNAYYNLPEYVRRSNILFRAGDSWISIPLPIEYRAIYGMGELMTSVFSGKEHLTGGEIAEAVLGQATQILPIDFLEGGGGLNAFVPSAAKPLWEAYVAEKSWTGMPLYKDTPFNKDMPEWTKAYSSTNKHIVNLAATLNEATGGDPYTKGAIDINPAKVEYMLNGYFGGVFGTIDKLTKTAETIVGDREYDPRSILLVNRLVKAGDERTEYRAVNNEYFRLKEEHDRLKTRLRHYEEDTDNGIFDYAEKIDFLYNSPEYERYEIFEDYRRDIDDLYDEMQEAVDDEERKDIEAELNELKKEMIQEMNTTRKRK